MRRLRVLHVEDVEGDVLQVERHLRHKGWSVEWTRVETADALREALRSPWDVILCDFNLPGFSALEALEIVQASERAGTPFIVLSGSVGEQAAIEVLLRGADDFVNKTNLARLAPAIERELEDAQVRLEKHEVQRALADALASREELIAIAGHEFRNPLAAIQITIDSLERSATAPEHAQALRRQVGRLRDLVTRFVDIAALDAGSFELRTSDLDLALVAKREVRRIAAEPDRIRLEAPEAVPVHADRGRLELVVASLLDNALKFGGGEPVEVRVRRDEEGGLLEVADRGPGLGEEERETVFRPFGKRVSSRHYGGFGLSLWLSRSIVERHGGSIVPCPIREVGRCSGCGFPSGSSAAVRPDLLQQDLHLHRLRDEVLDLRVVPQVAGQAARGEEEHRNGPQLLAGAGEELRAIHSRHQHVEDDGAEPVIPLGEHLERHASVGRGDDLEALLGEDLLDRFAHVGVVLHQEHRPPCVPLCARLHVDGGKAPHAPRPRPVGQGCWASDRAGSATRQCDRPESPYGGRGHAGGCAAASCTRWQG